MLSDSIILYCVIANKMIPHSPDSTIRPWTAALMFASVALLCRVWRRRIGEKDVQNSRSLLENVSDMHCEVLEPGLVILRGALSIQSQLEISQMIFEHGHQRRKWWARTKVDGQERWMLNNYRQGRGRIYDALCHYPGGGSGEVLRLLCEDSASLACRLDPAMPALCSPSHLLTLYYTSARKLGWHRDNGSK